MTQRIFEVPASDPNRVNFPVTKTKSNFPGNKKPWFRLGWQITGLAGAAFASASLTPLRSFRA